MYSTRLFLALLHVPTLCPLLLLSTRARGNEVKRLSHLQRSWGGERTRERLSKDGGLHWRGHQQWGHRSHDVHHHIRHVSNACNRDDSSRVDTKEK